MYSPGIVLAPIRSSPLILPRKPSIAWRASRDSASRRWAWESSLGLTHPRTGEPMTWEAPLPEDFQAVVEYLKRLE